MKAKDLLSETALSLTANKARSFLTILGIVVGISSVIVMVAIGNGTKASIESSIQGVGSNLIMVTPGGGSGGMGGGGGNTDTLTIEDAEAIDKQVSTASGVAPQVSTSHPVVAGSNHVNVSVTGSTPSYAEIRSVKAAQGSWFSAGDESGAARVAVLGPSTSDELFGQGSNPVGQRIRVGGQPFTVVGVAESKGSSGLQNSDEAVYIPITTMQRYLSGSESVSMIYVSAATQDVMPATQDAITSLLLVRHDIADKADADFSVLSQQDLAETANTVTSLLTVLLGSIAGISLLVGGIGIMNMMLTTVTERTREIGLRKAIGATRSDIVSQFLAEAVALTVIGGIIGIVFGWSVSAAIAAFSTFDTTVTMSSVVLAVSVSTAIGVLFGWYPARRAAKLHPIEALRYQ